MVDAIKFDGKVCESVKTLNELALRNVNQLAQIQVKAFQNIVDQTVTAGREAFELKGREDAQAYFNRRLEAGRQVLENAVSDSKAVLKMGEETMAEIRKIYQPAAS